MLRIFSMSLCLVFVGCSEYNLKRFVDLDEDEVPDIYDCDPNDGDIFPGNEEFCDGKDNNCDGFTDEGFDIDNDGVADCFDVEECDGVDNDADGLIDEGFGDADNDGIVDCLDVETCDGLDNDGDGLIDEDMDSDSDGIADCFDSEDCDGVDNDGDGLVDEGFDVDGDGTPDCFDDEECDGIDNDGDGLVDEDFPDTDMDGTADCLDVEECDGLDNDGDGLVDEGFPDTDMDGTADCLDVEECDGVDNDGDGLVDEGFPDTDGDGTSDCVDAEECDGLDNDGDGVVDEGFADTDGDGVSDCVDVEECDGLDNDGDGLVDEGFPDLDNDGIADCVDGEDCDGVDNNGDGLIDEGYPDTDNDGIADCVDTEECDGLDNDGDGTVDEGFDSDGDGTPDCSDTEECDGLDNDGDGLVDEGFDSDGDGTADCFDDEECDGVDNDGDGLVDEGFDSDNDGIADCYDYEDCDGVDNDGDGSVDEGFSDTDGDGTADCVDVEECDGLDNDGDGLVDEGFLDTDGDGTADCVDVEECDGLDNDGDSLVDEGYPDTDVDGVADCVDVEECDGLDNDGDGDIDEGYADLDGDGIADCADVEDCDGIDNDGDGAVDEGFPDTDSDGVADCVDVEECDGLDNDGDGDVDEGFPDTDSDGVVDCLDVEECDGLDNDGDTFVDEGFPDTDLDGIADCLDVEECDGLDNDGDGDVDEGFDSDFNGIADCFDVEVCDGVDNDGDGDVDEGFDMDGDGVARCCVIGDFFTTYQVGRAALEAHMSNQDNTFGAPEVIAEGAPTLVGQGRFDHAYQQDQVLWTDNGNWQSTVCLDGEWQTTDLGVVDFSRSIFGDVDGDGCVDMLSYDYQGSSFGSHGDSGAGMTGLGNCDGTFTTLTSTTWDVLFLDGYWTGSTTYNLADWNGDTHLDMLFWAVAGGSSGTSSAWVVPGRGDGDFDPAIALPDVSEAGAFGDLGDFDGDGCADWLVGPNDDGTTGAVQLVSGDCFGGVLAETQLLVSCTGGCYGDGHARFVDFDLDDDLDVMVSWTETVGGLANVDLWENDGSGGLTQNTLLQDIDSVVMATRFREWPANPSCPGMGMTWELLDHNATYSADKVGCAAGSGNCNPYVGDTSCRFVKPILCFFEDGSPNPGILMNSTYESWAEGDIALSTPTSGCYLTSPTDADSICESEFGVGWRMAEWHDGLSGWNWWAYGDIQTTERFWVAIDNQPANCWTGSDDDNDGFTDIDGDCDDSDPSVYPGAMELCDGQRNDCDDTSWLNDDGIVTFFADSGTVTDLTVEFSLGYFGAPETHFITENGELDICAGTYYTNVEIDTDSVDIVGIGGQANTVLSGGGVERVIGVVQSDAEVEISEVTLTEGYDCIGSAVSAIDVTDCTTGYSGYSSVHGLELSLRNVDIVDNESYYQHSTTSTPVSGSGGAVRMSSGVLFMEDTVIRNNVGSGVWATTSSIRCIGSTTNDAGAWGNSWYGIYTYAYMSSTSPSANYVQSLGCDFGTGADDNSRADIHLWRIINFGALVPSIPTLGDGVNTQFGFVMDPQLISYATSFKLDVDYTLGGGSATEVFSDSGTSGVLTGGSGGSGSIDYATGVIDVDMGSAPDASTVIYADRLRLEHDSDYAADETFYCAMSTGECQ
jgi:hypothetical protein